jgi:hypothetical protein
LEPAKQQLISLEKEMTPVAIDEGRRRASLFTNSPASALPVIVHALESNSVIIMTITPASPAELHLGERMTLKIQYSCQTRTVHFWVRAHKNPENPLTCLTMDNRISAQPRDAAKQITASLVAHIRPT